MSAYLVVGNDNEFLLETNSATEAILWMYEWRGRGVDCFVARDLGNGKYNKFKEASV